MKRPTERQTEFPVLELVIHPAGAHPVGVILEGDWYVSGEVALSYTTTQSLEDACRLVDQARNFMADELHDIQERERQAKALEKQDPPF